MTPSQKKNTGFGPVLVKLISTFFYVGFLPFVPGTFGSLAGLGIFFFLAGQSILLQITVTFSLIVLGFLTAGQAEKLFCAKDPKFVVIDEVCGMCISLLWVPFSIETAIAAFFLFRLLDTLKPFPAARLEDRHGSLGIMGDDIVAGVYANGILQIALRFASFKTS